MAQRTIAFTATLVLLVWMLPAPLSVAVAQPGTEPAAPAATAITDTVQTGNGKIRGVTLDSPPGATSVHAFRGIPFAAPPVGNLRWRPPQPVASWSDVRDCSELGPGCVQPAPSGLGGAIAGLRKPTRTSEDCLYLNVWTAAATTGLTERRLEPEGRHQSWPPA